MLAAILVPVPAMADITVKLPKDANIGTLVYDYTTISNIAKAKKRSELGTQTDSVKVKDSTAIIPIGQDAGGYSFVIKIGDQAISPLYAAPGDAVVAEVTAVAPLDYKLSGTQLLDGMNELSELSAPFIEQIKQLRQAENPDREKMQTVYDEYLASMKEYVDENPTSQASVYALMNLQGEDYLNGFDRLGERAKTAIIYPLAQKQYEQVKKSVEKEKKLQALQAGNVDAPAFTLKDLNGKDVSLSDFKGKWVILDFWGAWCPWCIKGFPELKEAYAKYKDELEIIGIDCNEGEAEWRAGVEKYELPWVNVYNPKETTLLDDYAVSGFPTKAIINPEGKIANITVGHNPEFFVKLTELMGK